jgi:flavin-binding protein dodecin
LAPAGCCVALTPAGLGSLFRPQARAPARREHTMAIAKIIELNASSKTSMEDAVKSGLKKCGESVKNIKGAWVNEIKVVTDDDGTVNEWRVNLRVSFIVE